MTVLLKFLLSLSLSGTLLILVIFLLKPLWKDRLSKRWQYYIWLIVVARLLLPFAPETNLVGTIFQQLETNVLKTGQVMPEDPDAQNPIIDNHNSANEEKPPATPDPVPVQNTLPLSMYIFLVWLVVALVLFVRKITIYQGFARYIRAGQEPVDNIEVLNRFGILLSEAKIRKNIELATNPLISSPLFMGLFRPCIVLPDVALADTDFCYTIRHELTHYKRRDMYYKWLVQLITCIHWFNPFVYLMGREISRSCELACDEAVIRHMNAEEKAAYGDTLLNAMGSAGSYKDSLSSVTLYESKELLKERLRAIMKFAIPSKFTKFATVFLTLAICLGATFTGVYAITPNPEPERTNTRMIASDRITPEQADEMALALAGKIWVWDWVAFFVPYMSEDGINQIIPVSESSEWAGSIDRTAGLPLQFTKEQIANARNQIPGKTYLTKTDIDAHALMIMQNNGQWDCVEFMLPYMTENGINQVRNIYEGKHGGQMPTATNTPVTSNDFDYSVFNRLDTMTSAEVDALALSYIATTGQFGHIYNFRPYMTTAGIDAAVKAYIDADGDVGVVLAMLPYMSETVAKQVKEFALLHW